MKKRIRRKQQRTCNRKTTFIERWQAKKFLKTLPLGDVYLTVYKCPICKKWHIACKSKELKILYLLKQIEEGKS